MVPHHAQERSLTPEARINGTDTAMHNGEGTMDNSPLSTLNSPFDAQAWKRTQATGWHAREPRHVHSLKWVDRDGIEHLHVLRADDLDDVLKEMATLKLCMAHARMQAAKKQAQEAAQTTPDPTVESEAEKSQGEWCPIHSVSMVWHDPKPGDTRPGWYSHRLEDGTFCRGKVKRGRQ